MGQTTIKSESRGRGIKDKPFDLDTFPDLSSPTKYEAEDDSPSKRVKLENGVSSPHFPVDVDMELSILGKLNEGDEEELKHTLRAAELVRARNKRNAIIAAINKKANRTPSMGNGGSQ